MLVYWAYTDSATGDRKGGDMLVFWAYIDSATGDRKSGGMLVFWAFINSATGDRKPAANTGPLSSNTNWTKFLHTRETMNAKVKPFRIFWKPRPRNDHRE
jgi:hypothetical protein